MRISDWSSDVCSSDLSQFREIQLAVGAFLHDLRAGDGAYAGVLAPDDYTESQRLGAAQRAAGSDGLVYPSVRCPGGSCDGLFYPDLARRPVPGRHLECHWNGSSVDLSRDAGRGEGYRAREEKRGGGKGGGR